MVRVHLSPPRNLIKLNTTWGCSSAGRAPALQAGGQEFDSPHLHHEHHEMFNNEDCQLNNAKNRVKMLSLKILRITGNLIEILGYTISKKGNNTYSYNSVESSREKKDLKQRGQVRKSTWRMPWHQEPKKDVISCDKPRIGANSLRPVDF